MRKPFTFENAKLPIVTVFSAGRLDSVNASALWKQFSGSVDCRLPIVSVFSAGRSRHDFGH